MAAISKASAPPRSPISARSRSGFRSAKSALLVALPQSPERRAAGSLRRGGAGARATACSIACASGISRHDEIALAKREPCRRRRRCRCSAPHAADQAVAAVPALQTHPADHRRRICRRTSRPRPRARPRARADDFGRRSSRSTTPPARCVARVGSADYFDERRAGQVDMTNALRSPGSTLKPFIYGLGFEDGLDPSRDADRGPAGALRQPTRRRIST